MKIGLTGANGFVGQELSERLKSAGHSVLHFVRTSASHGPDNQPVIVWDPALGILDPRRAENLDVVVHLAGESVANGRWTPAKKLRIYESRVLGTRSLVASLKKLGKPPRLLVSASAIGFYGDRSSESLDESSSIGRGFLARTAVDWEEEAKLANDFGTRVILLRFGVILGQNGGALARMLLPFRLGLGGKIGSGKQFMSWISIEDTIQAILFLIDQPTAAGPFNLVSPKPVTNLEFTKTLGSCLQRPTIFALPAFVARLALGEFADAALLSSARVYPTNLLKLNFKFSWPELSEALPNIIRS